LNDSSPISNKKKEKGKKKEEGNCINIHTPSSPYESCHSDDK